VLLKLPSRGMKECERIEAACAMHASVSHRNKGNVTA
jgi:hypothetical protein